MTSSITIHIKKLFITQQWTMTRIDCYGFVIDNSIKKSKRKYFIHIFSSASLQLVTLSICTEFLHFIWNSSRFLLLYKTLSWFMNLPMLTISCWEMKRFFSTRSKNKRLQRFVFCMRARLHENMNLAELRAASRQQTTSFGDGFV